MAEVLAAFASDRPLSLREAAERNIEGIRENFSLAANSVIDITTGISQGISEMFGENIDVDNEVILNFAQQDRQGQAELEEIKQLAEELKLNTAAGGVSSGDPGGPDPEDKTFLNRTADDIIKLTAKYNKWASKYPWLAEHGLQVIAYGIKAGLVVISGGSTLLPLLANEARGEIINRLTGEAFGQLIDASTQEAKEYFMRQDGSLDDNQAQALAVTTVLGTLLAAGTISDIKQYAPALLKAMSSGNKPSLHLKEHLDSNVLYKDNDSKFGANKNHVPEKYQIDKWEVKPLTTKYGDGIYLSPKSKVCKDRTEKIGNKEI